MRLQRPRSRTIALAVGAAAIALAAAAACSFPEAAFEAPSSGDDGGDGGPQGDASADASTDGFVLPPDVDPDGSAHDAATAPDALARPEAGVDAGCCDCDRDGYKSSLACGAPSAAEVDCDDFNAGIHPHQDFVASPWDTSSPHAPAYDWDCDTHVTKQYGYGVNCGLLASCGVGFSQDPGCAKSGTYFTCQTTLSLLVKICQEDPSVAPEPRTQGCR